jgi:2,3-diaminopropionate biosynthesis protein SbnB
MQLDEIVLLSGQEVRRILCGREVEIVEIVRSTYRLHEEALTSLPHSTFLHFPLDKSNRIIALPAYIGGEHPLAGLKWIASFPSNREIPLDRASAVIVLNSVTTGRPNAILEGSIISAKRTAASACLAATLIPDRAPIEAVGIIGCGVINLEILGFLDIFLPSVRRVLIHDTNSSQSEAFRRRVEAKYPTYDVQIAPVLGDVFAVCQLLSVATTASAPYINDIGDVIPGSKILNISLRDFGSSFVRSCDNVVDDIDHVCRAGTSVDLAAQEAGNRDFINCSIGHILRSGTSKLVQDRSSFRSVIFSPFGLGVLDLAVADYVRCVAREQGVGLVLGDFFPVNGDCP